MLPVTSSWAIYLSILPVTSSWVIYLSNLPRTSPWVIYLAHRFPTADARTPCLLASTLWTGFSVAEEESIFFTQLSCLQNPRKNRIQKRVLHNTKSWHFKCRQVASVRIRHQRPELFFWEQIADGTFVCAPMSLAHFFAYEKLAHQFQNLSLVVLGKVPCSEVQQPKFLCYS